MIECTTRKKMEDDRDLYEAFYKMANMVDLMYTNYEQKMAREEQEKGRVVDDAPYPSSIDYSSSSSSSHYSDQDINQSLQAENVELRRLLREEKEEKQRLQHQLQTTEEALEKLERNEGLAKPSSPETPYQDGIH